MLNRNDEDVGSVLLSVFAVKCYDSETMIKMIQKVKLPAKQDGISMNFKLLCFTVMLYSLVEALGQFSSLVQTKHHSSSSDEDDQASSDDDGDGAGS